MNNVKFRRISVFARGRSPRRWLNLSDIVNSFCIKNRGCLSLTLRWAGISHAKACQRMQLFFAYSWKLPAYSGAFLLTIDTFSFVTYNFSFLLTVLASLLTVGAFLLTVGKCV